MLAKEKVRRRALAKRPFSLIIFALAALLVATPLALWAYERYQTQLILNNNVKDAANDYADAMKNLNDELERYDRNNR